MIPYATDAPVYHWPIATVGLIVANTAAWIATLGMDFELVEPYLLSYGDGLHPLQWITSNFLHAGPLHLIGNMIFLWGFGLIVEGKIGWWRFLALYLTLGASTCAIEQAMMLGVDEGYSLGASAIVYGLIAVGMVWAPENELSLIWIYTWGFMIRTAFFELSIVSFAVIYLFLEVLTTLLSGLSWGSSVLHLLGAAVGFVLGTVMAKAGWVDCEGWDLFSIRRGRGLLGEPARESARKHQAPEDGQPAGMSRAEARSARALAQMRGSIEAAAPYEALSAYQALARQPEGWRPLEKDVLGLIALLQREGLVAESVPVMEDYAERFPQGSARVRLKLAQVLIRDQQRPARALRLLADLPESDLPADLRPVRRQLEQRARQMSQQEGGAYELDEG